MQGTLASPATSARSGRETFAFETLPKARRLTAKGEQGGERPLRWSLTAEFDEAGGPRALDLQTSAPDRPSEVTTVAFRCFEGRAFGTTIGPGGVPEKTDTVFPPGSAFRAFSLALDAATVIARPLRVGHGRRLLLIELDGPDLTPRITDGMVLAVRRERVTRGPRPEWVTSFEMREATGPGRAETAIDATAEGLPLRGFREGRGGRLSLELQE